MKCRQQIAVPAYFIDKTVWANIAGAGTAVRIVVPEQSFGTQPVNDLGNQKAVLQKCKQAGQLILGYVLTNSASVAPDVVMHGGFDSQEHPIPGVDDWYARYYSDDQTLNLLDGIFFDVGPVFADSDKTDGEYQQYYKKTVCPYVRQKVGRSTQPTAVHTPQIMINAPRFPYPWILDKDVADFVILWEEERARYIQGSDQPFGFHATGPGNQNLGVPDWWSDISNRNRIAHIVFGCKDPSDPKAILDMADTRNAGLVYVFDQIGNCPPGKNDPVCYNTLPGYWKDETTIICSE